MRGGLCTSGGGGTLPCMTDTDPAETTPTDPVQAPEPAQDAPQEPATPEAAPVPADTEPEPQEPTDAAPDDETALLVESPSQPRPYTGDDVRQEELS